MALVDLKSDLSWYGRKPKANAFEDIDAKGLTTDPVFLQTDYIGVSGTPGSMKYTHTGVELLGQTKKYSDSFDNTHQRGFTPDRLKIGASRPDTEFKGIDEAGLYSSTSVYGQLVAGHTPIPTKDDTNFTYSSDFTVSSDIKGYDNNGNWTTFRTKTSEDGFAFTDSNTGIASRISQLGGGSKLPVMKGGKQHSFDIDRTGFNPDAKYEDEYGNQSNSSDNKNAGLANTYTANSPIDEAYNKYNLRDDATPNHAWAKQPLILRGIQREGSSDPQRWGVSVAPGLGGGFDIPRGGLLTSTTRALIDTARITKFLISPKGIGFLAKQFGYQLMNPNLENEAGVALGLFKTQTYNPLSTPTAALLQHVGIRPFRHGMPGILRPLGGGGEYETKKKAQDITFGLSTANPMLYLNRLNNLYTESFRLGTAFKGGAFATLTGPKGPGSLLGLLGTTHTRAEDTGLAAQFGVDVVGKFNYDASRYKYGSTAPGTMLGKPLAYQNFRDNSGNGFTIEDIDTDLNKRSIYSTNPINGGRDQQNVSLRTAYENDFNFTQTDSLQSTIRNGTDKIYIGNATGERTNIDWSTYSAREYDVDNKYAKGYTQEDLDGRTGDNSGPIKKDSLAKRVEDSEFKGGGVEEGKSESGTPEVGIKKYKTNTYEELRNRAKDREPGSVQDVDFLKPGESQYDKEEASNPLVKKTQEPGPNDKPFDGGGISEDAGFNPGSTVDDYKRMSYSQLPSRLPTAKPSIMDFRDIVGNTTNEGGKLRWKDKKLIDIDDTLDDSLINFSFSGIKFKAFIGSLSEAYAPGWNGEQDQGRADPRQLYTSFERTLSLDFVVPIFKEDQRQPIWTKLQQLAHLTMPVYKGSGFHGQTVNVTIGDMFKSKEMIITDLGFDWDTESPWEIGSGKQAPYYTNVSLSLTVLGTRPEVGQKLYQNF
jgi:hypothetical protein